MQAICAVIVSYDPTGVLWDNVTAMLPQVTEVLIVDNGSTGTAEALLHQLAQCAGVKVIYNGENLGIATALNIGMDYATRSGYDWVATFDQDSLPSPDLISTMLAAYGECPQRARVALISPCYVDKKTSTPLFPKNVSNELYSFVASTMTSGNLVNVGLFSTIGRFDDRLFIDYVDHEFCLRLRSTGFLILLAHRAVLHHTLGCRTRHPIVGATSNHGSIRRYYIARNRLVVHMRYVFFAPGWVLADAKGFIIEMAKVVLVEDDAWDKLRKAAIGLWHGATGRLGKAPF